VVYSGREIYSRRLSAFEREELRLICLHGVKEGVEISRSRGWNFGYRKWSFRVA